MARLLFSCSFFLHAGGSGGHTAAAASSTAAAPLMQLFLVAFVVAAAVVSLCTSRAHAKLWRRRQTTAAPLVKPEGEEGEDEIEAAGRSGRKRLGGASLSGIGGRAAAVAKMVSWRKKDVVCSGEEDEEEEGVEEKEAEAAVWRKGIIMGGKCRPLQFSGHIAFDSHGNPLPPPGPPAAAVKKIAGDNPLPPPAPPRN